MTRAELAKILETFACCVISTTVSSMEPDEQYELITGGIDKIADTVMLFVDRPLPRPSIN
jgi:hypothetical protein